MTSVRTAFMILVALPILAGCNRDSESGSEPSEREEQSNAFDGPYDLSLIPWGSSIDEIRKKFQGLEDFTHFETPALAEDGVMWGGVKLSANFFFGEGGFEAINLIPQVDGPEKSEAAAMSLKKALERIHGPPNVDEPQANGGWSSRWNLPSTKVVLTYSPLTKELREYAILAYSRPQ